MLTEADSSWTVVLPGLLVASVGTGLFNPALTNGLHDALLAGGILAAIGAIAAYTLISKSYGAAAEAPAENPGVDQHAVIATPAFEGA